MKKISNPLTIIGVFCTLSEATATGVLPFLNKELQSIVIWFVIFFPVVLVALFFYTLNHNPSALYAPSDYKKDKSYLEHVKLTYKFKESLKAKNKNDEETYTFSEIMDLFNETSKTVSEYMNKNAFIFSSILSNGEKGRSISELSKDTGYSQKVIWEFIKECIENENVTEITDEKGNNKYVASLWGS